MSLIYYTSNIGTKRGNIIANSLGAIYIKSAIKYNTQKLTKLFTYSYGIFKDFFMLKRSKGKCIVVEIMGNRGFIAYTTLMYTILYKANYYVDIHTNVYIDSENRLRNLSFIIRLLMKKAQGLIIHNQQSAELLNKFNHDIIILESRIPTISESTTNRNFHLKGKINIVFITSFHHDEPIKNMIESTTSFSRDYHFYFTGYYNHPNSVYKQSPDNKNITFTGFLCDADYYGLISKCDIIVALTNRNYTLLYGGREALAFEKPFIVTNSLTNTYFFKDAAIYTDNTSDDLRDKIIYAFQKKDDLLKNIQRIKAEKELHWNQKIDIIKKQLELSH